MARKRQVWIERCPFKDAYGYCVHKDNNLGKRGRTFVCPFNNKQNCGVYKNSNSVMCEKSSKVIIPNKSLKGFSESLKMPVKHKSMEVSDGKK